MSDQYDEMDQDIHEDESPLSAQELNQIFTEDVRFPSRLEFEWLTRNPALEQSEPLLVWYFSRNGQQIQGQQVYGASVARLPNSEDIMVVPREDDPDEHKRVFLPVIILPLTSPLLETPELNNYSEDAQDLALGIYDPVVDRNSLRFLDEETA